MLPAPSLVTRKYMCQDTGRYLAFTVAALSGNSTRFPVGLHGRIIFRSGHTAPASVLNHITNQAVWSNCCESLQAGPLARSYKSHPRQRNCPLPGWSGYGLRRRAARAYVLA